MVAIGLYLGACLAAALLVVEHVVLAWRARRRGVAWPIALLLPAASAWQAREFFAAVRYGLWVVAYAALAISARVIAMR